MARKTILWGGLAVFALALAVTGYALLTTGLAPLPPVPFTVWLPVGVGLLLLSLITPPARSAELEARVRHAMAPHSVERELGYLAFCLAGFILGMIGLSGLLGLLYGNMANLAAPAVRLLFLLFIPLLLVDWAQVGRAGDRPTIPRIAMAVTEPWRWLGLIAVLVGVVLLASAVDLATMIADRALPVGLLGIVVTISVPEEIFFRGMAQTRLEILVGRWSAVLLTSLFFAATYAAMGTDVDVVRGEATLLHGDLLRAIATYGVWGVFYGYLWSCYRNIWLNIILRSCVIALITIPLQHPPG
ncbi:CPBP family intramembrane glutamic endopeptidase [Salinactinospora qingdaonensis]|uniref:CPBP family intramembrane glutamic endopeptidase n=1 Tax=Salinactinospora qingdaonensis TaxID=702744 RepID=UPI0031E8A045